MTEATAAPKIQTSITAMIVNANELMAKTFSFLFAFVFRY